MVKMPYQFENQGAIQALDRVTRGINTMYKDVLRNYTEDQARLNQRITEMLSKNLQSIIEKQLASFEIAMQPLTVSQAQCLQSIRKSQVSLDGQLAPFHESMRATR